GCRGRDRGGRGDCGVCRRSRRGCGRRVRQVTLALNADEAGPMTEQVVRARLVFAYDGTDFAGWATQPGLRTVQETLEDALARVTRADAVRTTVAGRTDAGVHARAQQAHVDVPVEAWSRMPGRSDRTPAAGLLSRLNGVLPDDIRMHSVSEAPVGFDAR